MRKRCVHVLRFCLLLSLILLCPSAARAASLAKTKPVIAKESGYQYQSVYMKWSAVKGAEKYEIYRAVMNPSTGKYGSWKKWATTAKTKITKKDTGDCRYRVRAVKGSTKGKWSDPKRIFSARAYITDAGFDGSHLNLRILVTNKSKSPMGFLINAVLGTQNRIFAVDKSGNVTAQYDGNLIPAGANGVAVVVGAKKSQSIYIQSSVMSAAEYARIKGDQLLAACSFYPNPEVEPVSNQLALACTKKAKESAIACR